MISGKPGSPSGSFRLGVALLASLVVHVGVFSLGAALVGASPSAPPPRPPEPSSTIRLGVSESTLETLTWLGFQNPTPHEATPSEVEQAAFALASSSASPAVHPLPPGATPIGLIERSESSQSASARARSPEIVEGAEATAPAFDAELGPVEAPALEQSLAVALPAGEAGQADKEGERAAPQQSGDGTESADANRTRRDGTPSERESPATSLDKPLRVQPGKPAAAEGLEIQTRVPPELTIPTRLLAAHRRAVYQVSFQRDGTVRSARLARASGNSDLDQSGLNAMYRWTAKGAALDKLDGEAVISVYIELIPPR